MHVHVWTCVYHCEFMYVFEWMSKLEISKNHAWSQLASGILRQWSISYMYNSNQTGMHTNFYYSLMHVKFITRISREVLTCYISSLDQHVTCHSPIEIVHTSLLVAKKLWRLEILKQPYLRNHSMKFYGTKTKLYLEASFIIMCSKESIRNNYYYDPIKANFHCRYVSVRGPSVENCISYFKNRT